MAEQTEAQSDILQAARKRFQVVETAENHIRLSSLEDIKFAYNIEEGQWPAKLRDDRKNDDRPCLTANKLRKFIAQVSNRERDMRLVSKVIPVDDLADVEVARIYDDLIRQIESQSNADQVYTKGGEQAIAGGFGYWRILTDWVDDGFDQEIKIQAIENQFSVYKDPRGMYCFIREGMPKDEFERLYPGVTPISYDATTIGEEYSLWYEPDTVFIGEYFYKEPVKKDIVQVGNEKTGEIKIFELKEGLDKGDLEKAGWTILKERTVDSHKIMWVKMTGHEIIEEKELHGKFIPVVEVLGDKVNIAGKTYKRSLIRDGKDPQRMYNYWLTKMTETVALAPNAPYMVSAAQISGHENMWNDSSKENRPYLLYNDKGRGIIPKREQPPQVPTGGAFMLNISNNDIQDTIGMFDASFGQKSNERSKIAIDARSNRSDLGTFHFPDNLSRAILHTAEIIIDLIPHIYDTERIVRIRGKDDTEDRPVKINEVVMDTETKKFVTVNDLSVGKYDVRPTVRSSATKRQEATQFMAQALQYAPTVAPLFLDLLFKAQDWDGAAEIAERIKKTLPALMQGGEQPPGDGATEPPVDETGQIEGV